MGTLSRTCHRVHCHTEPVEVLYTLILWIDMLTMTLNFDILTTHINYMVTLSLSKGKTFTYAIFFERLRMTTHF